MALPIVQGGPPAGGRRKVFLSYAREDAEYAEGFARHFGLLSQAIGLLKEDFFYDTERLHPGYRWDETLHAFLDQTDLLVFLVSSYSLSLDSYCITHEVPAAAAAGIPIVPVVVRPCLWRSYPVPGHLDKITFGQLGAVPHAEKDLLPVEEWPRQDAAWVVVLEGLQRTLDTLQPRAAAAPVREPRPGGDESRDPPPGVRTDLVAYLCNQDDPEREFKNSLRTWDSRALVVLVKGEFDDNPERFWERLRVEFLLDWVERGPLRGPPLAGDKPFMLPRKRSRRGFKEEMERDLLDELSDVLTGRALAIEDAADLASQMRTEKREGVISLLAIPATDAARDGIEALLRLIDKLPDEVTARMVTVVSLDDPALMALDLVTEWQLRRYKRSLVVDLEPLSAVTARDARNWHLRREIGTLYQVPVEDVVNLFGTEKSLRMRPFDARVQPLLRGRGRSG